MSQLAHPSKKSNTQVSPQSIGSRDKAKECNLQNFIPKIMGQTLSDTAGLLPRHQLSRISEGNVTSLLEYHFGGICFLRIELQKSLITEMLL